MIAELCDICDVAVEADKLLFVRQARPSDPSDMTCLMAGCEKCFMPDPYDEVVEMGVVPSVMTDSDWERWIEEEGHKYGKCFLT